MTEEKIAFYEKELYSADYTPEPEAVKEIIVFPHIPQDLRIKIFFDDAEAEQQVSTIEAEQEKIISGILRKIENRSALAAFTGDYNGGNFKLLTLDTHKPGIRITYFYKHLPTCHNSDMTPGKVADCFNGAGKIYIV